MQQSKNVFNPPSSDVEAEEEYLESGEFEEYQNDNTRNANVKLNNKKGSTENDYENDFE